MKKTYNNIWEVELIKNTDDNPPTDYIFIWDKNSDDGCSLDAAFAGDEVYTGSPDLLERIENDFYPDLA
jgi:hypothetical protein